MTTVRTALIATLVLGMAAASPAQTHSQLLERAIFAEETAGDLPGAIRIYARLAHELTVPRDIAAHARTRLTDTGRRHQGQSATLTAAQSRTPGPVQGNSTTRPPASAASALPAHDAIGGCCGMFSNNYDPSRPITIHGKVTMMQWSNPQALLIVDGTDGNKWGFTLASPNMMLRGGMNKNSVKLGEQVLISGVLAKGTVEACPAPLPNGCAALQNGALHASATVITGADGTTLFDRIKMEAEQAAAAAP
jgi:hypothetical protein